MQPLPIITPGYQSRSLNADAQRMINWIPESSDGGKTLAMLLPTPGLELDVNLGDGPIRGIFSFMGVRITVSGSKVFSGSTEIGTLTTSTGPVRAAQNTESLVIVDGALAYGWDGSSWTSLPDIGTATHIGFVDQYLVFNDPSINGAFRHTNLVSVTVDPLDVATAEGSPDALEALIVDHRQVWLIGTESSEVFHNFGDPDQVFQRIEGSFIEMGCAAKYSAVKADNAVGWLSRNAYGQGQFVLCRGYTPQIVSTRAIEYLWAQYSRIDDCNAWSYIEDGHTYVVLNFPTAEATWVFDLATGLWHERASYQLGRHIANCHCFHGGAHYVGDYRSGKVYQQSTLLNDDDGETVIRTRTFPYLSSNRALAFMGVFELEFETGLAGATQAEPQAMLSWSDDNGRTFSTELWRGMGEQGNYTKRLRWNRLGSFRNRIFKVAVSDTVRTTVLGAYGDVTVGSH